MKEKTLLFSVTLKDCDVQTKRGSGKGGQNRNKRDTAVRIRHKLSNAVGECEEERSQLQNKRRAFVRMTETPAFKSWLKKECALRAGVLSPEELVEQSWKASDIKTEYKQGGKWTVVPTVL